MQPQLKLYHYWRSSCSWRVRWALAIKGLKYESTPVNLLQNEHRSSTYLGLNPSGAVPTLVIDGVPFSESMAIMEWLDEVFPNPPLLPRDPLSRLKVRELMDIIGAGTQPIQNLKVQQFVSADAMERQRFAHHWITAGLNAYEERLKTGISGTYSFGGAITMADICLVPQVYNALRFAVNLNSFPLIRGIYERCLKDPRCDQAAPHNQPGAQQAP